MNAEVVLTVKEISKRFVLYQTPLRRFLGLVFGSTMGAKVFNSLSDISFELRRGECVGLVGQNGAGKSTLLQIIAGTQSASSGKCEVSGRIAALLELGAGFNPEYSGRENIHFTASLLGLSDTQVRERLDSIIEFADIGEHIDQPVRTYSSGMYVRLAFAIQASIEPEILIVDEALAVGDASFQSKCFRRLRELRDKGTSILLVTHDTQSVRLFCDRAIWIDKGQLRMRGSPADVTAEYLKFIHGGESDKSAMDSKGPSESPSALQPQHGYSAIVNLAEGTPSGAVRWGKGGYAIVSVGLHSATSPPFVGITHGHAISITVRIKCLTEASEENLGVAFAIKHRKAIDLICETTSSQGFRIGPMQRGEILDVTFDLENILAPDEYLLAVAIEKTIDGAPEYFDFIESILAFRVIANFPIYGLVRPAVNIRIDRNLK